MKIAVISMIALGWLTSSLSARSPHPIGTWVKLTPTHGGSPSPKLGYEGACVWDPFRQVVIRYGGHNQGGGGEQGSELWTLNPITAEWQLHEPNQSPPGVCCNAQNVFDPVRGRYLRFPHFSGSHGWQWWREIYLNDASVWSYDLARNTWRNLRPLPAPRLAPLRCASWDSDAEQVVVFGGEGSREGTLAYDPARNEWRWMHPPAEPEGRSGGNMAYDAARKVHVLFGAQFSSDPHTWLYDLKKNEWRNARPRTSPPTDKNDAVLTYDPLHEVVLAIVKISSGKEENETHRIETWAYDAGSNRWTQLNPAQLPDAAGNRTRQLLFAPELDLAILENCTSQPREQQVWTFRFAFTSGEKVPRPPSAPRPPSIVEDGYAAVVGAKQVEVKWTGLPQAQGYHLERAPVEVWTEAQLVRLKRNTPPLTEPSVGGIRRVGQFIRLTETAIQRSSFIDTNVDLHIPTRVSGEAIYERTWHQDELDPAGKPYRFGVYAYRVRTVLPGGQLSGPSPPFFTIPSAPQWLFSRELDTQCELKWNANPEPLRGYRVYRLDGRWDKDPVSRLTAEPLAANSFIDSRAGRATRRYYVVAVDALGQEGFPSSPVWFAREWGEYYRPFVREWHQ